MKKILLLLFICIGLFAGGVDPITGLPARIDANIYELHAGDIFRVDSYFDADSGRILVTTDSVMFIHMIANVSAQDSGVFEIRETVTASAPGDTLTALNAKRTSSDTLMTVITKTPTITDYGTLIEKNVVGADGFIIGSEWILKQRTTYLIKFTPASSSKFALRLKIYEASGNRDN